MSKLSIIVASVVTVLWALSLLLDMILKDFDPHPSITPLMIGVGGLCFGGELVGKRGNNGAN